MSESKSHKTTANRIEKNLTPNITQGKVLIFKQEI